MWRSPGINSWVVLVVSMLVASQDPLIPGQLFDGFSRRLGGSGEAE
jgi:hypothetical protein